MSSRSSSPPATTTLGPLASLLRCVECGGTLAFEAAGASANGAKGTLACSACATEYRVARGTPRMLPRALRDRDAAPLAATDAVKLQTADSFAYEWEHFGALRAEWRRNFLEYMRPHSPGSFRDRLVLDVGSGSGRHSFHAAALGARVVAVDLGDSIDITRRNLPPDALTVQADAERLPFEEGSFDFVMSIGVLHHLPDPPRALRAVARYVRPGGWLQVYLYWEPPLRAHRAVLRAVTTARKVTVRMPHRLLHALCYPLAAVLYATIVLPYRRLRGGGAARRRLAAMLPLKAYADYSFGVLVNDQFDRFSAPIENRYARDEVAALLRSAGLIDVEVHPNNGWVATGRRPGVED